MSVFFLIISILQAFAVSLGVGSSTLAIINFFAAIADGTIEDTERRMMGIVYVVLRIAMWLILATAIILIFYEYSAVGLYGLSTGSYAFLLVLFVLYTNAILMTLGVMPSTFGPALQAGSWYTLGVLNTIELSAAVSYGFGQFIMAYVTCLILAIAIVNAIMSWMKSKLAAKQK